MKKGLSIIEVMFALTLVAITMAATSPILLGSMQSNGDSRIRAQAVSAAEGWHDRFRAKTLDFTEFTTEQEYSYDYNYADDTLFYAAGDPDVEALNREWQPYKFEVVASQFSNDPLIWKVKVNTFYHRKVGDDSNFEISSLIAQ